MSERYSLRTADTGRRTLHLAKFRSELPTMRNKSASVVIQKGVGRTEPPLTLTADGDKYEGAREAVGVSGAKNSSYMVFRVDSTGKVLAALPAASWFSFKPAIKYETLTIEEVEEREAGGKRKLPGLKKDEEGGRQTLRQKLMGKIEKEQARASGSPEIAAACVQRVGARANLWPVRTEHTRSSRTTRNITAVRS
eukprot:6525514-Prymnesium_polylepis.1